MLILTEQNFKEEVLQSRIPVLVDFYADWCGPCQMMGPVIEGLEGNEGFEGKIKIGKINIDENQALAERYGVMSIPTVLIVDKGEVVKTLVGLQMKETLIEEIKQLMIK